MGNYFPFFPPCQHILHSYSFSSSPFFSFSYLHSGPIFLLWSHFPPLHDRFSFISFSFAFFLIFLFQFSFHCLLAFLDLKSLEFLFLILLALIDLLIAPSSSSFSAIFLPLSFLFCLIFSFSSTLALLIIWFFFSYSILQYVYFLQWFSLPFPESGAPCSPHFVFSWCHSARGRILNI